MAKGHKDEVISLGIVINGDSAQNKLIKLEEQQRKLKEANKDLRLEKAKMVKQNQQGTQEWKNLNNQIKLNNAQIKENEVEMDQLRNKIGLTGLTINQLKRRASELRLSLTNMIPGTAKYKALEAELGQINNRLGQLRTQGRASGNALARMSQSISKYRGMFLGLAAGITGVVFALSPMVQMSAELSDAQADVQKTTNLTKEQVRDLTQELDSFDTRTPRLELLKLSEEAGRLGKTSTRDILAFTETANMLKVALGDDLGGEEAIRDIGKLTEQYKVGTQYGTEFGTAMEKLGSGINQVAQSGNNQASFLVDYLKRLSGISDQVKINAQDQLGYAATFDEAGQSVETAATATSKALVNMFDDTETYARIAGMGIQDFTQLMNEDANAAFIKFLEGLNGNNEGMAVMVEKLNELDIDGARAVSVLSSLAANTEKLKVRQAQANQAMHVGNSLLNEYNIKNENLAGNLERIKNAAFETFISGGIVKGIENIVGSIAKAISTTETFEQKTRKTQAAINSEIEALKNGEFTVENRNRLIGEINTKYGDYLPNLIDEKDSYEDIVALQKQMNAEFEKKILYAAFEEEIKEAIEAQANALESIYEQEKQIAKARNERNLGTQDLAPGDADLQEGLLESLKNLNQDVVENTDSTKKEIEEKYKFMFEQLGSSFDEFRNKMFNPQTTNPDPDGNGGGGNGKPEDSERAKAERELQKFLDSLNQDELDKIKALFEEKIELAKKYGIDRTQLEEEFRKALDQKQSELDEADQAKELADLEASMQQLHDHEELNLLKLREEKKLSKEAFDQEIENLEIQHLQRLLDARKLMGEETIEIEKQLAQAKIKASEQQIEANEDLSKSNAEAAVQSGFAAASQVKTAEDVRDVVISTIRDIIAAKIAETIAAFVAQEISEKQWVGLITGVAGGAAVAALFNSIIPSFDTGMYDVIDHKGDRYRAKQNETMPTGMYTQPTFSRSKNMLIAEKRPELVVDGLTTQRLINFRPDVIQAIQDMRFSRSTPVQSYDSGNYPAGINATATDSKASEVIQMNTAMLARLSVLLEHGVNANIGDSKIREMKRLMETSTQIEDQA